MMRIGVPKVEMGSSGLASIGATCGQRAAQPTTAVVAAGRLAGRVADATADGAEGVGGGDGFEGACEVFFPDIAYVGGCVGADGAGDLAGGGDVVDVAGVVDEF